MVQITSCKEDIKNLGVKVFNYKQCEIKEETDKNPVWLHFGPGNLFKCMQAKFVQNMIEEGKMNSGLIAASNRDFELQEQLIENKNRVLDVILKADGTFDTELIGSIAKVLNISNDNLDEITQIFINPSLQIVSFTITEKGYKNYDLDDKNALMYLVTVLLFERYKKGSLPIAMVSSDNFSHNGDVLKASILEVANYYKFEQGFIDYLNNDKMVSFPLSMIDRITPAASPEIAKKLNDIGFEDAQILSSESANATSIFVNTEETNYWVIEDNFANGRPDFNNSGIIVTTKEKVDEVERMKVCTCLNPLHTTLAVLGCLLGFTKISDEARDEDLSALIKRIGYIEGLPVVVDPKIINPKDFLDEVIEKRLPNPYIPDQPQRIAMDTSQKVGIRYGETIKLYSKNPNLDVQDLIGIAFSIASWLRYLLGIDDKGEMFERSSDPLLDSLNKTIQNIKLGDKQSAKLALPILKDKAIFGIDLEEAGLSDLILNYLEEILEIGKVREVLKREFN